MYRAIIVPLDGSQFAEHAIPAALAIGRATGADLHLVHVHVSLVLEGIPPAEREQHWDMRIRDQEVDYLQQLVGRVPALAEMSPTTQLLEGDVATALMEYGKEIDAGLIVMATHGRGGLNRAWIGSVADDVVRRANLPVLLIRPSGEGAPPLEPTGGYRRILLPVDGSELAEQIVPTARALGEPFGATYVLLRVTGEPFVPGGVYVGLPPEQQQAIRRENEVEAREYLAKFAEQLQARGTSVETRMATGAPAPTILQQAQQLGVDAIAIATHGHGATLRLLLGSVADKVLRGATVPVLVYRPHEVG